MKNLDIRYEFVSVGIVDTIWKLVLYLRIYFTWSNSNTDLTWNYLTTICMNYYGVNLKYKNWNIEIVGFWQTWNYRIMKWSCSKPRLCYWPVVSSLCSHFHPSKFSFSDMMEVCHASAPPDLSGELWCLLVAATLQKYYPMWTGY